MNDNVINLHEKYKVIPCSCGCFDFFIKESRVSVCQECDHEMIIHDSKLILKDLIINDEELLQQSLCSLIDAHDYLEELSFYDSDIEQCKAKIQECYSTVNRSEEE